MERQAMGQQMIGGQMMGRSSGAVGMKRLGGLMALALPALLAACGGDGAPDQAAAPTDAGTPVPAPTTAAATTPGLAIEGEGLRLFDAASGSARPLPFGTDWKQVKTALAFRGDARRGVMEECGAGPLDYVKWGDSLTLYGQDGKFVGWFVDSDAKGKVSTASGIGPGSTRSELENTYTVEVYESTLGTEFAAGDLAGLFANTSADAPITALWAGTSCNFR